jgi:hypothetical protein
MNKIFKILFLLLAGMSVVSCHKDDSPEGVPLKDYAEQYLIDGPLLETYLDTHYITVDANYDVTIDTILPGTTQLSIRNQTDYPLQFKTVTSNSVEYKLYYLKLREGINQNPTALDSIYTSYKGNLTIKYAENQFDYASNPVWLELENVIPAWSEIFPLFKTGTYDDTEGPDPIVFDNYGAGVMFVPSGLGYFGNIPASGTIPTYSNLVFNFKLYELRYKDHDRDGIYSKDEVLNPGDNPIDYDSDGDGLANMYDTDDDGDHYLTKDEIRRPAVTGQPTTYYPFTGAAVDDAATPFIDETQGIPRAFTGPIDPETNLHTAVPADFTDPTRLRRYLDPTSYPPFE